jgi:hemoglobin-like flavoprotein
MTDGKSEDVLLRESFDRLQSDFDQFSTYFYEALFRRAPELRAMFRDDLTGQGMKFMTTLREISLHTENAEHESERLEKLGSYHGNLGVTAENFAPMEEALIDTLRETLGDALTPELESAWRNAYTAMSKIMIRKGGNS